VLTRILPILMAVGSAGVLAKGGTQVVTQMIETVRVVMTRSELAQCARLLEADAVLGHRLPTTEAAFANYLRDNLRGRSGRDVTLDMWDSPYRLGRDERRRVVLSVGANGKRDACVNTNSASAAAAGPAGANATAAAAANDDVCVKLILPKASGRRNSGDSLGADSPFRQIGDDR
jgi:hypothetical protein